jgi:hypothetical protein
MIAIMLNDEKMTYDEAYQYFESAGEWARKNCQSFVDHEILDVADFSLTHDVLAQYQFKDEKDATIFLLRWR